MFLQHGLLSVLCYWTFRPFHESVQACLILEDFKKVFKRKQIRNKDNFVSLFILINFFLCDVAHFSHFIKIGIYLLQVCISILWTSSLASNKEVEKHVDHYHRINVVKEESVHPVPELQSKFKVLLIPTAILPAL